MGFRVESRAGNGAETYSGPVEWAGKPGPESDQLTALLVACPVNQPVG